MARADRAFALLVALAVGSGAILIALLATLIPHVSILLKRGADDAQDIVALLLLGLALLGIGLGVGALFRQLSATAGFIRSLLARRVPVPRDVGATARGLGLSRLVDIVDDPRPFSFCYWFLRPRICISTGLLARLDGDEVRAVLLHERYHLRHRDPLRLVIARYFAAGLYVVPVVDELVSYYTLQKEIAADEEAVREARDVRPLAAALYKLLPDADSVDLGLLLPVGSLTVTEARIEQLVNGMSAPLQLSPVSIALSGGALLAASVLAFIGLPMTEGFLPPVLAVPGLLVAPASLLFAAAVSGGAHQLRVLVQPAHVLAAPISY
ncbi:MAG: M48 family metalloprotease [Chloroflexota bacterium]|nr:M48 family metalloprotease [Chloroflexota bacterium]